MRLRVSTFVITAALAVVGPVSALARVPQGFVGMNVDGPMLTPADNVNLAHQFDVMEASGVESVRTTFSWAAAQPYESWADVPAGQASGFQSGAGDVPTSFAATDQMVELAAKRGVALVPTVIYTPTWDQASTPAPGLQAPATDQPYGAYLTTLIGRYGPHGSFWSQHPSIPMRPIRMWEVWNEPDIVGYWPIQPFATSYVALLRAAHSAIKRADPGARVVLAGIPNASWKRLAEIYKVPGSRRLFDIVDVHPYTKQPAGVIEILKLVRGVMNKAGDAHKQILAGETGWPSSLHRTPHLFDFETTPAGEARNVRALLPLLATNRRRLGLLGFDYYTWVGDEYQGAYPFNFSGLFGFHDGRTFTKPAAAAFSHAALALEGCKQKGRVATVCARR
jgi:hypothetical protein